MNDKIKAELFAKYYGQRCLTCKIGGETEVTITGATLMCFSRGLYKKDPCIILRSILSVTMPEIKNILRIMESGYYKQDDIKTLICTGQNSASPKQWLRVFIERAATDYDEREQIIIANLSDTKNGVSCHTGNDYWRTNSVCLDYLRSIGIITPFTYTDETGTPITVQQDDIIESGLVKIV